MDWPPWLAAGGSEGGDDWMGGGAESDGMYDSRGLPFKDYGEDD